MKKIIAMLLVVICVVGLVGCNNKTQPQETTPSETEITQQPTIETPDIDVPEVDGPMDPDTPGYTDTPEATTPNKETSVGEDIAVVTKYFTVTLPSDWESNFVHEVTDDMHLSLYEAKSHDAEVDGWLVSVELFTAKEDYDFLPSFKVLGRISTDTGEYDMVAIYPTDVQFSEENAEQYIKMSNQIEDILTNIVLAEGVAFITE